jgi:hypothetical protein
VEVTNVAMGATKYDLAFARQRGAATLHIARRPASGEPGHAHRFILAPAFPADARIRRVTVNGVAQTVQPQRIGDEQRLRVTIDRDAAAIDVVFTLDDEGTDVEAEPIAPSAGAANEGLRVLRAWADSRALHLVVEGLAGRSDGVRVRSSHRLGASPGVALFPAEGNVQRIEIAFEGTNGYLRRDLTVPLSPRLP